MPQSRTSGRGNDPRKRGSGAGPRPAARRTPTARAGARPEPRPGGRPGAGIRARGAAPSAALPPRPRFTSRAAVLVLVLAVLTVSYASSMRAYLQQRREIDSMRAEITTSQASITSLEREKRRWNDATYIKTIAHQRLGWVMPGEIGFQVIDDHGRPLGHTDSLSDPTSVTTANRPLWWQAAWGSVVSAGKPPPDPATAPAPATRIKVPTGSKPNGQAR